MWVRENWIYGEINKTNNIGYIGIMHMNVFYYKNKGYIKSKVCWGNNRILFWYICSLGNQKYLFLASLTAQKEKLILFIFSCVIISYPDFQQEF